MDSTKRSSSTWTQDGHMPRIKVQGGYIGPVGRAPTPPKGGSSFKPAAPHSPKSSAKK